MNPARFQVPASLAALSLWLSGWDARAQTVTYSWGDPTHTGIQFIDTSKKGIYEGFDNAGEMQPDPNEGTIGWVGEGAEQVYTSWIDWDIGLPTGVSSSDLTSASLRVIFYDVTLANDFIVHHLSSPASDPAVLGDFEYNDDPTLAPGGPSGAPVAGYTSIGSVNASAVDTLAFLVNQNYSGGAVDFAAGLDPDQGPYAGGTRDDILDAATVSIALDLSAVRTELDGDNSLSLLLGTTENPYDYFDGGGASNRDFWEYAADGGGIANTYGTLGPTREMQLVLEFQPVPEPSAALLLVIGLGAVFLRRPYRRS